MKKVIKIDKFVTFKGAMMITDDDTMNTRYEPWDDVVINVAQIGACYDHTIIVMGHKIRVMETLDEIRKKVDE